MKIIVAYSGGKDSQASLIWSIKKYGKENITALFCDTGWENPITYEHINSTCKQMNVQLVIVKSEKYDGFLDLAQKKGRFPSVKARFCTIELKSKPINDYILSIKENIIVIQGIRSIESFSRSKMSAQCNYWKFYFEAYNEKGIKFSYRKRDVIKWCEFYNADVIRPIFNWTDKEVIDYILTNGQNPNPLYKQGFKRVGCFPCIMSRHQEVLNIIKNFPKHWEQLKEFEAKTGSSFFAPGYIPKRAGRSWEKDPIKIINKCEDVEKYLKDKNSTMDMFEYNEPISCSSFYHLCE